MLIQQAKEVLVTMNGTVVAQCGLVVVVRGSNLSTMEEGEARYRFGEWIGPEFGRSEG
jgi:hypothetical protein